MPRCWRSRTSRRILTTGESRPPGPSVRSGETQLHACERDASSCRSGKLSFSCLYGELLFLSFTIHFKAVLLTTTNKSLTKKRTEFQNQKT